MDNVDKLGILVIYIAALCGSLVGLFIFGVLCRDMLLGKIVAKIFRKIGL